MRLGSPDDDSTATPLRGWLSDVFLPALLEGEDEGVAALARRLGHRAFVADPVLGRGEGAGVEQHLRALSSWLTKRGATFERSAFLTGTDRDATLGRLRYREGDREHERPAAVVAEKRRAREVELRLYFAPVSGGVGAPRVQRPADAEEAALPGVVTDLLAALGRGDATAALETFETTGALEDALGQRFGRGEGALAQYLAASGVGRGGLTVSRDGVADDSRSCALELTVQRFAGRSVEPTGGLAVFERGDSGLIRTLRLYATWPAE